MTQAAWNQTAQSPDLSGHWNHTNAQAQTAPYSSAAPGNNILISTGGRPPSWTGQGDVPSPTFMQNLSMQSPSLPSPVQQDMRRPTAILRSNSLQMQPGQNTPSYGSANWNGMTNQTSDQVDQRAMSLHQQQVQAAHHHQQLHLRQGIPQPQQHLLANGSAHQQVMAQLQPMPHNSYPHLRQNQIPTQSQLAQQNQQQLALQQQVLNMNRAAQLRPQQQQNRFNSRNNSIPSNGQPSPSVTPAQVPMPSVLMQANPAQLHAYNQSVSRGSTDRQLIPPIGYTHAGGPVTPDVTALHQAHVRSPRLVPADFEPATKPEEDPTRRYYQTVQGFALDPVKLPNTSAVSTFDFTLPNESYALIPKDKWSTTDRLPSREYRHGTLQYRLRCIQTTQAATKCLAPDWVVTDTNWPESIFIALNDNHLDVRRKTHHGKDLPIDITSLLLPPSDAHGSVNHIKISVPRARDAEQKSSYFIAIEVIEIIEHYTIIAKAVENRVARERTIADIQKALGSSNAADDDDDFAMVVSDLSVDLADPFTARIFDMPVRGSSCLHRECFDLHTWLMTRQSKSKRPYQPCMVDVWKCPLCGRDARPYSLQYIEYFSQVRSELAKQDNLDCKAILIAADGSWRPKPEAAPAQKRKAGAKVEDEDTSDDEAVAKKAAAAARAKARQSSAPIEIIALDD
jgi:hypothetical protein